jgi:hypothetical protein
MNHDTKVPKNHITPVAQHEEGFRGRKASEELAANRKLRPH